MVDTDWDGKIIFKTNIRERRMGGKRVIKVAKVSDQFRVPISTETVTEALQEAPKLLLRRRL